jgi:hypothetical protein
MSIKNAADTSTEPITTGKSSFSSASTVTFTNAAPAENILNKKSAGQQFGKPARYGRNHRVECIAQSMPPDNRTAAQPFCISRADVILVQHIEHAAAGKLGNDSQGPMPKRNCRQYQVLQRSRFSPVTDLSQTSFR